ncbi:MAG TPA: NADH-quinone oxidoreductase subunit L [Chryseolinea sp.]
MVGIDFLVSFVPLFPLLGFLFIALNTKRFTEGFTSFVACGSVLASFIVSFFLFIHLIGITAGERQIHVTLFDWISAGHFKASISFLIDPLSSLMLLIITGVGFLIHVYSIGYMHDDAGYNRFFSYLNLFVFFMLLLVMGSNYLVMFIGWEGVGLCSYLLIGFWFKNQDYNDAANKAFIMNRIGDLGMLLGIVLIFMNFGSLEYSQVFPQASSIDISTITLITILLFVGAMGKSAQIPLYTWLPDAMAGPTPVSALIHAATMVTAGVYMVARNNLLYSLAPVAMELIVIVGLATALFAATIALTQNDIKKVLAYSTVSQLGLMFLALGLGNFTGGIFHMATHAFFKALLFLGAGSVIHALHHEQDIRKMGGLKKYLPITYLTFLIGVVAISGIPPFAGFFSKDEILAAAFAHNKVVWVIAVVASMLTVFYMFRLLFLTFFGTSRASEHTLSHVHESPQSITIPLIVLAVLSAIGGFMGIPEALGGSHWLESFLAPVFAESHSLVASHSLDHSTEYMLMGGVVVLTLIVIAFAYTRYVSKRRVPVEEGQIANPLQQTLYNKYYVDEIYDWMIVKPLYWLSEQFYSIVEKSGIDMLVNASGRGVESGSKFARLIQNGSVGYYIFVMVIGIALLLGYAAGLG